MSTTDINRGRLGGKVAIVSGAARGLGAGIARLFAEQGAAVLVTDIRDSQGARTAEAIAAAGGTAIYQRLDVTVEDDWAAAVERCRSELGTPNVLVSNACYIGLEPILSEDPESWRTSIEVNLTGHYLGFRAVLPTMIAQRAGSIIAISSTTGGDIALPTQASYQAAKAGLTALIRHVAVTHGPDGVRANSIHPGPIRTDVLTETPGFLEAVERMASSHPLPRLAEVGEIAAAAAYLASGGSSYTTGTKMVIDGDHYDRYASDRRQTGKGEPVARGHFDVD
jgi:NAD(P)-dependent dehydrogenase (short-subunit alcohol dehydrogenase family)